VQAKEYVITGALLIWLFLGLAIIFADLWIPIVRYLHYCLEVVGDPILFILSLAMFLLILWNITFYLKRRKELHVARKLIKWIASQRTVVHRTDKEKERVDRVLQAAIWALRCGESVRDVIDGLSEGTRDGNALHEGWARSHYETAIRRLIDAVGRNPLMDCEEREKDIEGGEKMLWATRTENLRAWGR